MVCLACRIVVVVGCLVAVLASRGRAWAQTPPPKAPTLEERLPLELIFADSIVPQDRHETMLTTGGWMQRGRPETGDQVTQKVEWGVSDHLQVSAFWMAVDRARTADTAAMGIGDLDLETRYSWRTQPADRWHVALALNVGLPTGNVTRGLGGGVRTAGIALLLSGDWPQSRVQVFMTTGVDAVAGTVATAPITHPRDALFVNGGVSIGASHGWAVVEVSVTNDRWDGGQVNDLRLTPAYVFRLASRCEVAVGVPLGLTRSASRYGAVAKFTFEMGGG
jgi:hypothetical protein